MLDETAAPVTKCIRRSPSGRASGKASRAAHVECVETSPGVGEEVAGHPDEPVCVAPAISPLGLRSMGSPLGHPTAIDASRRL